MTGLALRTVDSVAQELEKLGETIELVKGDTYRNCSTVVIVPTRGMIHNQVVHSWVSLAKPMNQKTAMLFVSGDEVGVAYNRAIASILDGSQYGDFQYVLTLEDDNIIPASALLLLLQSIKNYDAVGGLYHMKSGMNVPMAFGKPENGPEDFYPVDLTEGMLANSVVPVNGVACGCTLWRLDLFRKIERPWFQTWTRFTADDTVEVMTQDIFFCKKALAAGAKFAIDTRVRVGHIDIKTGQIY